MSQVPRRIGKEVRERAIAGVLLVALVPLFAMCAAAIAAEGALDPRARGPVLFREHRMARGRRIGMLKFRTLDAATLAALGPGPTHIKTIERRGHLTRVGAVLRRWYLDELPQLWNIVRGDMLFIGTRPYPMELYEAELARGITRKRDMPGGLLGPVQGHKGDARRMDELELDAEYWTAYQTLPGWRLLLLDLMIVARCLRVLLEHRGL